MESTFPALRWWENEGRLKAIRTPGGQSGQQASPEQLKPFAIEEYQPISNKTICIDKLNTYAKDTQRLKSFQKLEADSILEGKNSFPFWNELSTAISSVLSLPTQTESDDSDLNWLNGYASNLNANSWFSTTANLVQSKNSLRICCPSSTVLVQGFTDSESTQSKSKKTYKKKCRHSKSKSTKPQPNSVQKIRLYPDKELHRVWKRWLAGYRYYYNETIALLRCFDGSFKISAESVDKLLQQIESIPEWVKQIPGHQRQEACFEAFDAFWRAKKDGSTARFKSAFDTNQTIQFKNGNYRNGTWYCKTTKGLKFVTIGQSVPYQCQYGTELVYRRGKWFGCFPEYKEVTPTLSDRVIALDPGNRTFLTGYDGENVLEIGKGDIGRIQRLCQHLDQLISRSTKVSCRQRSKMRIAANRIRERIQNLIKDLHQQATSLLVNSYKVIFLPTFDSSQMVIKNRAGKKRKINHKSVRQMLTLSHYKFERHLKQAAIKKGVIIVFCNESYTSKTCGSCGYIHHSLGGAKVFKCPRCGQRISRDANGARNILLRALQATAFTVTHDSIVLSGFPELTDAVVNHS